MSQEPTESTDPNTPAIITPTLLRDWQLPQPEEGSGKEARGRVLVVGGARETPGAVILAGVAALRAGAGKLQMGMAEPAAIATAVAVPEAGVAGLPVLEDGAIDASCADKVAELATGTSAVLLGPGMSGPDATRRLVDAVLPQLPTESLLVLDALALTCGAVSTEALKRFEGNVVMTPNTAEMSRLLSTLEEEWDDESDTVGPALRVAAQLNVVVAFEDSVATPDGRCWRDGSGNVGLGTSGSGDVLAGVVAGLAARGAEPEQAAVYAVHMHGQAGDRLAAQVGRLGFLARELLEEMPRVLAALEV